MTKERYMAETNTKPVIVVTGGGQGIGKAIVLYFAERDYDVAVLDLNLENAIEVSRQAKELGADALAIHCDVTDRKSVSDAYEEIGAHFGRINVQVNNAGIFVRERIEDFTDEVCDRLIDVNLKGVLNTSRAAIKLMKDHPGGSIINAHSILGQFPDFGLGVYCATKAAVACLTRVLAAECAPYGIRVNGYAPSVTDTPMVHHIIEERPAAKLDQIPMREFGKPEQIARICWFLATDLSEYTTGIGIASDGGAWAVQRPFKAWEAAGKL
jgi:3-oxoacyl-[acyl-carrier protein] reductase